MRTVLIFASDAAWIFSFRPPTGPMSPPEFIVPVIDRSSFSGALSSKETVNIVAAAPALGPPIIGEVALIV